MNFHDLLKKYRISKGDSRRRKRLAALHNLSFICENWIFLYFGCSRVRPSFVFRGPRPTTPEDNPDQSDFFYFFKTLDDPARVLHAIIKLNKPDWKNNQLKGSKGY